jgi:hypothetical protein
MRICIIIFAVLLTQATNLYSQGRPNGDVQTWKEKIGVGGNLGLRIGNPTYFEVSPIAGYRLSPFLMPGVGVSYRYIKYRMYGFTPRGINLVGASAWMRVYPVPMVFGYAEYELLNGEWDPFYRPGIRSNIFTTFVGAGYSQEMNGTSSYVMVLFAVNQEAFSPYVNPVIRVGFMIGGTSE